MVADRQSAYVQTKLRIKISDFIAPVQYVVDYPIRLVNELFDDLATQHSLAKENISLRTQLLFMRADMQKMIAIQNENRQLKELLQSSAKVGGKVIEAQILAVSPDPYLHQIILDKGKEEGVYVGQPVLDAYGVMGQVIQVGKQSSRALLITDNLSSTPVQDSRNGVRAIATGNGSLDTLRLHNVTQTMDIQEGDLLITSGLDQQYPYGYPVGTVSKVKLDSAGQFVNVWVRPAARLNRSRLVMLVWSTPVSIDPSVSQGLANDEQSSKTQLPLPDGGAA